MRTIKYKLVTPEKKYTAGFSLLELAIFMMIAGLMVATTLQTYKNYINGKALQTTKARFVDIDSALTQYQTKKGYLPCPADPSLPPSAINSGIEISTCSTDTTEGNTGSCTSGGYCRSPGRDANGNGTKDLVLSGYVPYNTLGLAMKDSLDGWDRKIKYVVSAKLTQSAAYNAAHGAISVISKNGANALPDGMLSGTGQIALLSHGNDGKAAYTLNGNLHAACPAALTDGRDFENCDEPANATYYDKNLRSFVAGAEHYDDVIYNKFKVVSAADRWNLTSGVMGGGRRVGIGTSTPTNRLHVAGNIKAGAVRAAKFCEYGGTGLVTDDGGKQGTNCIPYSLFGTTGTSCATGAMTGIKSAVATCATTIPSSVITPNVCLSSEVMCGLRADKSIRCRVPTAATCPP